MVKERVISVAMQSLLISHKSDISIRWIAVVEAETKEVGDFETRWDYLCQRLVSFWVLLIKQTRQNKLCIVFTEKNVCSYVRLYDLKTKFCGF